MIPRFEPATLAAVGAFLFAFLLGSVPFGLLVARFFFGVKDLPARGSGNIGATNVSRVLGFWPAGAVTFGLDVLKGALPVLLVSSTSVQGWLNPLFSAMPGGDVELTAVHAWAAGFFAVLGHCFSPWLRFRGGKGVATAFGAIVVLAPIAAVGGLVGFGLMFLYSRIGSLSSMAGLLLASVACLVFHPFGSHLWLGGALVLLVMIRHEGNLDALLDGREKSFD